MNFTASTLPLAATHQFSQLFLDYISAAPQLQPFYSYTPDEDGCVNAASELNYTEANRSVLVAEISRQYAAGAATLPQQLLEQLAQPGASTICTGHQLVLLGGPLFFVYKILTTIKAARTVSLRLQKPVVPVFWMASEDHDIDEIRRVNLYGKTLSWNEPGGGAVGHLRTDSLEAMLAELEQVLGTAPGAPELAAKLREIYAPGQSLADATRRFVHFLFGEHVLVLDADSAELKRLFLPQLRAELETGIAQHLVTKSIAGLEKNGYSAQVNPRAINLFYLGQNTRERIDHSGNDFLLASSGRTIDRSTLLAELEQHPERFSPNVVMRPLYQQCILPNIAYIGGPGELAYWLEFRSFFEAQKVSFPVLLPRAFMLVVDKGTAGKLTKLQVQLSELFQQTDMLLSNYVKRNAGAELSFESEQAALQEVFAAITAKASQADATLRGAAESTLQQIKNSIAALESKVLRAAKQKEETSLDQIRKLREKILPGGVLQERSDNILPLLVRYGMDFIHTLEENISPGDHQFVVLTEQ